MRGVCRVKRRAVGEERGGREEFRRGGHDSEGEREEREERRQKEREEREKEWVKKAGGDATRNRRVFGVLLGTLQRFRKDQTAVAEKVRARVLGSCVWSRVADGRVGDDATETGARA
jgi:hypothetical protein